MSNIQETETKPEPKPEPEPTLPELGVLKITDVKSFVEDLIASGAAEINTYIKTARIEARAGEVGEEVVTKMANGLEETRNVVKNVGDMIVTNPSGEMYIIKKEDFEKKYESVPGEEGVYRPKGGIQNFIEIPVDIEFRASWGEVMIIKAGGFLNVTNLNDIYGIQKDEFEKTYKRCDEKGEFL